MPKVVLCGYYGQGNAGDEALLVTLLQMLPETVEPIVLSHNPAATTQAYGVKAVKHKSMDALKAIAGAEGFLWGGGSLMQDVSSLASPIYYGALMKWAQLLGKKTIAWGQGLGPLNRKISQWLTRSCLKKCDGVSVRDQGSAHLLDTWNIDYVLAPDPVWALAAEPLDHPMELPQPRIAINLRSHGLLTPEKLNILTTALKILQENLNASIILVPFQQSQDGAIAEQLYAQLSEPKIITNISQPQQFKSLFQQVDFLIGMRLHSLIMAAAVGCPCFALSYDPKVSQLQQQCTIPGFELETLPKDPGAIAAIWLEHFQHRGGISPSQQTEIQKSVSAHRQLLSMFA